MSEQPILFDQATCPYCTSPVSATSYTSGRLSVHHEQPYREGCEAGLRRLLAEAIEGQDLIPVFRHDN